MAAALLGVSHAATQPARSAADGEPRFTIPRTLRENRMSHDFRASLIAHARVAIERSGRAATEAATNQYLVLPFIQFLGYDPPARSAAMRENVGSPPLAPGDLPPSYCE